jgi:hypothetical protein
MELSRDHYKEYSSGQDQLAVFDLVGELLAISLEKHDVEVVVDSKGFLSSPLGLIGEPALIRAMVDCEEVIESDNTLKITLSGGVQKNHGLLDSFMLVFFIIWSQKFDEAKVDTITNGIGINTLWLQFGRKAEQFTDTLFKINLYRKDLKGRQFTLGHGEGFLVFDKEKTSCLH